MKKKGFVSKKKLYILKFGYYFLNLFIRSKRFNLNVFHKYFRFFRFK